MIASILTETPTHDIGHVALLKTLSMVF